MTQISSRFNPGCELQDRQKNALSVHVDKQKQNFNIVPSRPPK